MGRKFQKIVVEIGACVALTMTLATGSLANEASALRQLATGDDSRAWDGVGKLDLGDGAFCTGALISERLVLTAAHCVYDKLTRSTLSPEGIRFLAGWRDGRAAADRKIRRILPHPEYDPFSDLIGEIRYDVALLELDHPIRNGQVAAFDIHGHLAPGREIGVVSYAHDRAERPSVQEVCNVIGSTEGFLIMSCEADFGASGAPVFVMQNGKPAIVSVVSAKAKVKGEDVSLGSDVTQPLDDLLALAAAGDGVFHRVTSVSPTAANGARSEAKFLRP